MFTKDNFCLLGYNPAQSVQNQPTFRRNTSPPSSFTLVSCLAYSSTLKLEATRSSETSADFQRATRRYIPQHRTIHNHRCENLKCYMFTKDVYFMRTFFFFPKQSCGLHGCFLYCNEIMTASGEKRMYSLFIFPSK
jgi:hypothetical protein